MSGPGDLREGGGTGPSDAPNLGGDPDRASESNDPDAARAIAVAAVVSRRRRRQKRRLVIFGVVLLGAFGFLLVKGLTSSLNYFVTVNQAEQERATLGTSTVQLEGLVVPGSVHTQPGGVSFTMESSGVSQAVVNVGSPPELFQANIPVVVVGHFAGTLFRSNQILVKHTASYVAEYPNRVKAPNGTSR